jgi:hypothetical protein
MEIFSPEAKGENFASAALVRIRKYWILTYNILENFKHIL